MLNDEGGEGEGAGRKGEVVHLVMGGHSGGY